MRTEKFAARIVALALLVASMAQASAADGEMKPGSLRRGADGRLYLDTSAASEASPSAHAAVQPPSSDVPATPSAGTPPPVAERPERRTITVCRNGCDSDAIGPTLQGAREGDTILVKKGVYTDGGVLRANNVTLHGEPGAHLKGALAEGKAAIVVVGNNAVIDGLECSDISSPDRNGACLRVEGRNLTVRNVHFHDAEEGILTTPNIGVLTIEESTFERLGAEGRAHAIYCGDTEALVIRKSTILASKGEGHEVKSRAARTVIEDSIIASMDGLDSRALDIPNGGEVILRRTVLEKGLNSSNGDLIGFALEGQTQAANSLTFEGVTVILDRRGATLVNGQVQMTVKESRLIGGDHPDSRFAWFADRTAAGLAAYPALTSQAAPLFSTVTAKRVCAVGGNGCDYTSLAQALREAETGAIITVAPGIYKEAAVLRANRVTVKAEPGALIQGVAAEGKAALVIKGDDAVIDGLECSDIAVPDHNGACIRMEGHNLTLRRVRFHDSETGLLANDDSGDIAIEDSRFERLGSNGRAHGLYVNKAHRLTIRRTTVADITGKGHGIKSRAAQTLIENSVIATLQGQDSRLIDVPNGGDVVIRNCVLEKGPASDNDEAIGYGLEGTTWTSNSLLLENSTIIMDRSPNALLRSTIGGQMKGGRVIGGDRSAIKRGLGKLVGAVFPGKGVDTLDIDSDVQWLADRKAAGLPAFPALPKP